MLLAEHENKLLTNVKDNYTKNFQIGDASVVIGILRNNLYQHKIRTSVQEYICNARDAMRECGKFDNNFDVTMPNDLNPVFKVRDYGPGISPDRMEDVFTQYGASTKRKSNTQTGGFGIGAKSAWSFTDSFSIVTYIDGTKRTYVAHVGVNNNGRLDLVTTESTKEVNGTEIQIAVKKDQMNEFRNAIYRCIYFWDKKPNLKGELTPCPTPKPSFTLDNVTIYSQIEAFSEHGNRTMLIIDGVKYVLSSEIIHKIPSLRKIQDITKGVIGIALDNGEVEVIASRESVADSKMTIDNLTKIADKAHNRLAHFLKKEFLKVTNTSEFFEAITRLYPVFDTNEYAKYDGYAIYRGDTVMGEVFKNAMQTKFSYFGKGYYSQKTQSMRKNDSVVMNGVKISEIKNCFTNNVDESALIRNKRIKEYLKTNDKLYILESRSLLDQNGVKTNLDISKLILDFNIQDLSSITYVDPPRAERVKRIKEKEEFILHKYLGGSSRSTDSYTLDEIHSKWLYVPMEKNALIGYNSEDLNQLGNFINEKYNMLVCGISSSTLELIKDNEFFSPLSDWISNFEFEEKHINGAKNEYYMDESNLKKFANLPPLNCPFLSSMVKEYKEIQKKNQWLPRILHNIVKENNEVKTWRANNDKFVSLLESEYSLTKEIDIDERWGNRKDASKLKKDLAFYINAKYDSNSAVEQTNKKVG